MRFDIEGIKKSVNKGLSLGKEKAIHTTEKLSKVAKTNGEVLLHKGKTLWHVGREKAVFCMEKGKVKWENSNLTVLEKVNFNFHHFVTMCMVALVVFFITLYSTGYNTATVDAEGLQTPEVETYNDKAITLNYGDHGSIANIAKEMLADEISVVSEPKLVSTAGSNAVYALDDYKMNIQVNSDVNGKLGEATATVTVQSNITANKSNVEKLSMNDSAKQVKLDDGARYTYYIRLHLIDTEAPRITLVSDDTTIDDTDAFDVSDYVSSVTDNVDGVISYSVEGEVPMVDDKLEAGTHTLTIRAKDSSGNESTATLTVRVNETEDLDALEEEIYKELESYGIHPDSPYAGSIVAEARRLIGSAYVYGANGPYAFDCSGFVQYVYSRAGISIPRTSGGQTGVGVAINPYDMSQWRAGDIVLYNGHAAIYSGYGTLIHALNPTQGVMETWGLNCGAGPVIAVRRVQ